MDSQNAHGRTDADLSLEAKCAATRTMISLIASLPENCANNIQILPQEVVKAFDKICPKLLDLIERTLAKCLYVYQSDSDSMTAEDELLSSSFIHTYHRNKNKFQAINISFDTSSLLIEEGFIIGFDWEMASALHLSKLLNDVVQQSSQLVTQFQDIKEGLTEDDFLTRWPRYESAQYRNIVASAKSTYWVEKSAKRQSATALIWAISEMGFEDREDITILPSYIVEAIWSLSPECVELIVNELAECISLSSGYAAGQTSCDRSLSFIYMHNFIRAAYSYSTTFEAKLYGNYGCNAFGVSFDADKAKRNNLKAVIEQTLSRQIDKDIQVKAVGAGIGKKLFLQWWPHEVAYTFANLRTYTGKLLKGGITIPAEDYDPEAYRFFVDAVTSHLSNGHDEKAAHVFAWERTKSQFKDVLELSSFIVSYSSVASSDCQ